MIPGPGEGREPRSRRIPALACLLLVTGLLYGLSNPNRWDSYYHTEWAARLLLSGQVGTTDPPPAWMERAEYQGRYFCAFPLGAVLTMVPVAFLQARGVLHDYPSSVLAALIGMGTVGYGWLLAQAWPGTLARRLTMAAYPALGTWMWENLGFAGSWQLANGMAVLGQTAMLYYVVAVPSPWLAGLSFAAAVGNRTELGLLLPLVARLLWLETGARGWDRARRWQAVGSFLAPTLILALLTGWYNQARFGSPWDFGYLKIPHVTEEEGYKHGLFSFYNIGTNARFMLWKPWEHIRSWPYWVPGRFGCSIFLASPYLLTLWRRAARPSTARVPLAWAAMVVTTAVLWCHGNPGGYQFGYRYALELLPWATLALLENAPPEVPSWEAVLLALSFAVNALATWLFLWTPLPQ